MRGYIRGYIGLIQGDTRSVDYGSYGHCQGGYESHGFSYVRACVRVGRGEGLGFEIGQPGNWMRWAS